MIHICTASPQGRSAASRPTRWLALAAAMVLLQACGSGIKPSWIEAPLVADAYRNNSGYFPRESQLLVNNRASAQLKFNYATLPSGTLAKLSVDRSNTVASVGQESYALNAGKVASARLVLYVDKVEKPGYLQITSAHQAGADCFAREDDEPTSCDQIVSSTSGPVMAGEPATDADNPTQPLRVTERGFYSFDVTQLVKYRLDHNADSMLVVSAVPDPAAAPTDPDSVYGSFEFASKEQQPGNAHAMHQPQLLVSLTDAAGSTYRSQYATSVRQSSNDPAVASQNFNSDENLWMNGATGDRAYALVESPPLNTGGFTTRTVLNQIGTFKGKQSLIMFVNAPVQDQATAQPEAAFYARASFNWHNSLVRSWNDGWAEPPAPDRFATAALDRSVPNQQLLVDASTPYMAALARAYNADDSPNFAVTGTTNLQVPLTLDSDNNTRTAHGPRFVSVLVDETDPDNSLWGGMFSFDKHDRTYTRSYCNHRGDAACRAVLSMRARLGQPFASVTHPVVINPWAEKSGGSSLPYATPINIVLPTSGASAVMDPDPDPASQGLSSDMGGGYGYYLYESRANRVAGRYQGIINTPGHNLRTVIEFENLPLPTPTLSGPAAIDLEPGSTTVTVAANAPAPLRLSVADPVGANIDDTTKWIITSSNPADTMPGEIQQSQGSVAFAATFSGLGPRTLQATSKGDSTITATLNVTVNQGVQAGQVIVFTSTPPASPLVGGTYTVTATGGASGNPVTFSVDATSTAGACTVMGGTVNLTGAGTCTINADQAGNASYAAAARVQQTFSITATGTAYSGTTVPLRGPGRPASASFAMVSGTGCSFDLAHTRFAAAGPTPPGKSAPQGALRFKLVGCTPGATVRVTTTWPQAVADFTKHSRGAFLPLSHFTISGNTVSFDVTDGGLGDDDGVLNGEIVDPAMPLGPAGAQAIPTLSEWGLLLLSLLACALGLTAQRRQTQG